MTNFTNEQLEAWAGLGPWRTCNISPSLGHIYGSIGRLATSIGGELNRTQTNAALIAAAPTLAAALLAERKAREVEVGELRAVRDAAERLANFDTFQPIPLQEIKDQFKAAMMDLVKALKGQANEAL